MSSHASLSLSSSRQASLYLSPQLQQSANGISFIPSTECFSQAAALGQLGRNQADPGSSVPPSDPGLDSAQAVSRAAQTVIRHLDYAISKQRDFSSTLGSLSQPRADGPRSASQTATLVTLNSPASVSGFYDFATTTSGATDTDKVATAQVSRLEPTFNQ